MATTISGSGITTGSLDTSAEAISPAELGNGAIIQVVQTVVTAASDVNSGAIAADTDYTLMSRTITPTTNTNKILITASFYLEISSINYDGLFGKLMRDSTQICLGDAAGSRNRASFMFPQSNVANRPVETTITYLDSPATTSEITYAVKIRDESGSGPSVYFNRGETDTDADNCYRLASTLTCMEVVA